MRKNLILILSLIYSFCFSQVNVEYDLNKAKIFLASSEIDSANYYAQKVLKADKKNIAANYIKLYIADLNKNVSDMDEVLKNLSENVDVDKATVAVYKMKKLLYEGKQTEGRNVLKNYLEEHPENYSLLLELGDQYVYANNFNEAISYFNKAVKLEPKNLQAYRRLTKLLIHLGREAECLLLLKEVIEGEVFENQHEFYYILSLAYIDLKYYDKAIESIDKALSVKPLYEYLQLKTDIRATVDEELSSYKENKQSLLKNECDGDVLKSISQFEFRNGYFNDVMTTVVSALKCKNIAEDRTYFYQVGMITSFYLHNNTVGEKYLNLLIEAHSIDSNEIFLKAITFAEKGKYKESLEYCKKAAQIKDSLLIAYLRIFLYLKLKDETNLIKELDIVKKNGNLDSTLINLKLSNGSESAVVLDFNTDYRFFQATYSFSAQDIAKIKKILKD